MLAVHRNNFDCKTYHDIHMRLLIFFDKKLSKLMFINTWIPVYAHYISTITL